MQVHYRCASDVKDIERKCLIIFIRYVIENESIISDDFHLLVRTPPMFLEIRQSNPIDDGEVLLLILLLLVS